MSELYVVNNNDEHNPGGHHEMHTITHAKQLRIESYKEIGYFENELEACSICCPKADTDRHRG